MAERAAVTVSMRMSRPEAALCVIIIFPSFSFFI